jgi:hypothetical protein
MYVVMLYFPAAVVLGTVLLGGVLIALVQR